MPVVSGTTGLHETLAVLTSQLHPDARHREDLSFLKDVLSEKSLAYLMKIHEKLKQYEKLSPSPVLDSASCLAEDLADDLQNGPLDEDERELLLLLSAPHLKAVLSAHDTVAQKNFDPVLPTLPDDLIEDFEEESVKIVRLVKNKEPLGATIRRDEATGAVIVARIMRGGAADRSGLVHVGDELREVNGKVITHRRPMKLSQSQGSITLKIVPAVAEEDRLRESRVYLRALFEYTPYDDKATPCQEAGLPFKRGDILQVVSQEDATWWQAKKVGDSNLRAALIPSAQFQERSVLLSLIILCIVCLQAFFPLSLSTASLRRSFRLKKDRQALPGDGHAPEADQTDFLIYEEVTQYLPRPDEKPRLIVLIGSLGARISELKQKVIAENPRRYGLAVPHTTRARRSQEREGVEYHFISKNGEYKDNLYGTSLESIHRVLAHNKVCLVDVQPEALKTLRTAEFQPYVIFVRPRIFDSQRKLFGSSSSLAAGITEDDLMDMQQSAEHMDECYGHWVDYVLLKEDSVSALIELQVVMERVQKEPQWVPVCWLRS
uniref:Membrane protein, palmitoylated 3b (MAGUK p55 subfamily member 3) n=1 Tax=Neogobius melanostomus TaxID=47308 RepID=A0A8C6SNA7_9GOBI